MHNKGCRSDKSIPGAVKDAVRDEKSLDMDQTLPPPGPAATNVRVNIIADDVIDAQDRRGSRDSLLKKIRKKSLEKRNKNRKT